MESPNGYSVHKHGIKEVSEMNTTKVYKGKFYVFRVKASSEMDWNATDLVHGVAHEGNDGLTFTRFKDLSVNKNRKYFFSKKINTASDDYCTGEDIQETLEEWGPIGIPLLSFVDIPVTFYAVAKAAYEHGVFTDSDAFNKMEKHLEKKRKKNVSAPGPPVDDTPASTESNHGKMLDMARHQSKELERARKDAFALNLPQGALQLAGIPPPRVVDVSDDEDNWENMAKEEIFRLVDDWKSKALKAEEKALKAEDKCFVLEAALSERDNNVTGLEQKVNQLDDELGATKKAMADFMASADLKTMEAEATKKATDTILESLKPLIAAELQPVKSAIDSTLESLALIKSEASDNKNILLSELQASTEANSSSAEASAEILLSILNSLEALVDKSAIAHTKSVEKVKVTDDEGHHSSKAGPSTPRPSQCTPGVSSNVPLVGNPLYNPSLFATPPPPFMQSVESGTEGGAVKGEEVGIEKNPKKKKHQRDKIYANKINNTGQQSRRSLQYNKTAKNNSVSIESVQQQLLQLQQHLLKSQSNPH